MDTLNNRNSILSYFFNFSEGAFSSFGMLKSTTRVNLISETNTGMINTAKEHRSQATPATVLREHVRRIEGSTTNLLTNAMV